MRRKAFVLVAWAAALSMALVWLVPSTAQEKKGEEKKAEEKKAEEKKAEKKKAEKATGDIGLLDTEKNYMILVTKEGKLLTFDFDQKATKVLKTESSDAKMADVGLGSAAVVEYQVKEDKALDAKIKAAEEELNRLRNEQKRVATKIDFVPAKGE